MPRSDDRAEDRGEAEDLCEAEPAAAGEVVPLNRAILRGERGLDMPDWQASATRAACENSPCRPEVSV